MTGVFAHIIGRGCGTPDRLAHGQVAYISTSVGSKAKYSCQEHYTLVGARVRVCLANGNWAPRLPVCKRRKLIRNSLEYVREYGDYKSVID